MNKRLYPANWREIREAVKERAAHRCEECGAEEGTIMVSRHTGKKYILYLHAAHIDGFPGDPHPRLRALCPSCHMKFDRRAEVQDRPSARRRGYQITTTDRLIRALQVAGLDVEETPTGYEWSVDGLEGRASNAVNAVADAIYYLRQVAGAAGEE